MIDNPQAPFLDLPHPATPHGDDLPSDSVCGDTNAGHFCHRTP